MSATPLWQNYLPEYVHLYYVDYRDDLSGQISLLQAVISKNSIFPLFDNVWDWWDFPESYYLNEVEDQMAADGLEKEFDEYRDDILYAIQEKDDSDPVEDLLRNTGKLTMFYSLGVEIEGWNYGFMCSPWKNETDAQSAYKVRRALGIKKGTPEDDKIGIMVSQANGGELRIYFQANLDDVIAGEMYCDGCEKKDFHTIHFKGKCAVAIYNAQEGSGDFELFDLDKTFTFNRENLFLSDFEKYNLGSCFGMCSSWLDTASAPQFSVLPTKRKSSVKISKTGNMLQRDAEYNRIFKAGGCTYGDMDYKRHRDVYYDNNVPCGSHCPHCGSFWID